MSLSRSDKDGPVKGPAVEVRLTAAEQSQPVAAKQDDCGKSQTGTVKWYNLHKGFGFIRPSTGGNDVFVHVSALEKVGLYALVERQRVAFDLEEDPTTGRFSAANLRLLG